MKKLHYRRDNYPVTFKWIKPDDYFDGELISGYKPTLFDDEDVRAFIANL